MVVLRPRFVRRHTSWFCSKTDRSPQDTKRSPPVDIYHLTYFLSVTHTLLIFLYSIAWSRTKRHKHMGMGFGRAGSFIFSSVNLGRNWTIGFGLVWILLGSFCVHFLCRSTWLGWIRQNRQHSTGAEQSRAGSASLLFCCSGFLHTDRSTGGSWRDDEGSGLGRVEGWVRVKVCGCGLQLAFCVLDRVLRRLSLEYQRLPTRER